MVLLNERRVIVDKTGELMLDCGFNVDLRRIETLNSQTLQLKI